MKGATTRREFLDYVLFWNATDLQWKLDSFKSYYNSHAFTRRSAASRRLGWTKGEFHSMNFDGNDVVAGSTSCQSQRNQ